MYCFRLRAILVCFTLLFVALATSGNGAYAASQAQINAALQKSADMRHKVENMMERGKKYDSDIKQMVLKRDETLKTIYEADILAKQVDAKQQQLSNDLQKINFDKDLNLSQWRELSNEANKTISALKQQHAALLQKLKIKRAELDTLNSELEELIRYAKKLDKERAIAFDQWELAEEQAKAALNGTETSAGGS